VLLSGARQTVPLGPAAGAASLSMETGSSRYRSCRARYSDSSSVLSPYPAAAENPPRGRLAGTALLRLLLVGGLVLLVGDWFEPGGAVSSGDALEHGEVAHEVADGGVRNPV